MKLLHQTKIASDNKHRQRAKLSKGNANQGRGGGAGGRGTRRKEWRKAELGTTWGAGEHGLRVGQEVHTTGKIDWQKSGYGTRWR